MSETYPNADQPQPYGSRPAPQLPPQPFGPQPYRPPEYGPAEQYVTPTRYGPASPPSMEAFGYPPQGGPGYTGVPTSPRKKSHTSLWVAIAVVVVIVAAGGFAVARYVLPGVQERNAHVSVPHKIGSLVQSTDPNDVAAASRLEAEFRSDVPEAKDLVAAVYKDPSDASKPVIMMAATGNNSDPEGTLDAAFTSDDPTTVFVGVHDIDPGPLGGSARCGSETDDTERIVFCAWSDHGSFGATIIVNRDDASSENLFRDVRAAVLSRD
jgi:hypothetical protein